VRRNQRGRGVGENRSRALDLKRGKLRPSSSEADWGLSRTAIAEAGALLRLAVGALIVMGVTRHRVGRTGCNVRGMGRSAVHARALRRDVDRQPTVHDARVELRRLRQTDGEPNGYDAGETAEKSSATHESNIGGGRAQNRAATVIKKQPAR
jgi:hypothetical protein